jgi:hypothetical protein
MKNSKEGNVETSSITIGVSIEYVEVIALQAELESIKARIAAMITSNEICKQLDKITQYGEEWFDQSGVELKKISKKLYAISEELKVKKDQVDKAKEMEVDPAKIALENVIDEESGINAALDAAIEEPKDMGENEPVNGPLVMTPMGVFYEKTMEPVTK